MQQRKADLEIEKVNEVFSCIRCEPSVARELSDFFCFFVPGYKFMPAYRNKLWNGKINLYNQMNGRLYNGLLPLLPEFCKPRKYSINVSNNDYYGYPMAQADVKPEDVWQLALDLNLQARGQQIKPRDYQLGAVHHALVNKRLLLISPTASGKSLIIYILSRWFMNYNPNKNILLVVPTTSLVEQMVADFGDYSAADDEFDPEIDCHKIYSGQDKTKTAPIIVTTWQSAIKMPKDWFKQFGMIIGDEAHTFKAKSLTTIMEQLTEAEYRIGTTGTLDGTQCFSGDTLITTIQGYKMIMEVQEGDLVATLNESTKEVEYKPVLNRFDNGISEKMLSIKTDKGEMIVTHDHEIFTINGWKKAKDLSINDKILYIK